MDLFRHAFPAPRGWAEGQALEVDDVIQVPSASLDRRFWGEMALVAGFSLLFKGWIGTLTAVAGILNCCGREALRNPPRPVTRSLRLDEAGRVEVRAGSEVWRFEVCAVTLWREPRQYRYNWFFDVEQVILEGTDVSVTLESLDFSCGMPSWSLEPLAQWLSTTLGTSLFTVE